MENVQTSDIQLDITLSNNQNGATLGEQKINQNNVKIGTKQGQDTSSQQQVPSQRQQIQYASANQLHAQPQHHQILQVPSDQTFIIPTQIFHTQLPHHQEEQQQHTYGYTFPVSSAYNGAVSSTNSSNVNYLKIVSSSQEGGFQTSNNSNVYTMQAIKSTNIERVKPDQQQLKQDENSTKIYLNDFEKLQGNRQKISQTKEQSLLKDKQHEDLDSTNGTHFKKVQENLKIYATINPPSKTNISNNEERNIEYTPLNNAVLKTSEEQHQEIVDHLIHTPTKSLETVTRTDAKRNEEGKNAGRNQPDESSDEEDVHQCGRCKQLFNTLPLYMEHKASKVCRTKSATKVVTSPVKENVPISQADDHNILAEAAKNTIFRDSFITIESEVATSSKNDNLVRDFEIIPPQRDIAKEGKGLILKLDQNVKRKRGRPPKNTFVVATPHFNTDNQEFDIGNPDSPPKAKRKSRPPRRHRPDEDLVPKPSNSNSEQYQENFEPSEFNVTLSSLDPSGLPTVENIQKYFSRGRGRGRGRGRKSIPHHRCPICQLLFPNRLTMLEHKRKHTKQYKCKTCNEGFYTEEKLEKHSTKETHAHPCDQCDKIFVNKATLLRHKISHSDKIMKCDQCSRSFKSMKDLHAHKLGMHSETYDFVCEVCNKAFSRREKLKRHLMIHAPDRPIYTCPFKNHVGCEKTFYRKDKLTRHLYSHSKVKPFKCEQCDKSFARTDNLREHIRSHTGVFRYYCTVCGKGQPGPKKFVQHMYKQHNVENPQIPKPYEDLAPESLIQQHKAVVQAEADARLAKAATNLKREKEKTAQKLRKDELEAHELHVDPSQGHVTLTMSNLALQAVNGQALIASPQQPAGGERPELELYSNFQITRQPMSDNLVRQISENLLRENITVRENRESITRDAITQHDARLQEIPRHHLVESPNLNDALRRQLTEASGTVTTQTREVEEQQTQQQQQAIPQALTVEAEGSIPVTRGLQLIHQGVLPGNLQFTALLNSDLVAIGDIRNSGIPAMFQQKFSQ